MPSLKPSGLFALFLTCALFWLVVPPSWGQPAETMDITPAQAREALEALEALHNDERRDEVVRTLEAIAGETANEAPAAIEEQNGVEAPAESDLGEEETPLGTIVPLEADGLIARTLDQVSDWANELQDQLLRIGQALTQLPAWMEATFFHEQGRLLLWQALADLVIVLGLGLCLEWALRRVLRRAVRSLMHSAQQADVRASRRDGGAASTEGVADSKAAAALGPRDEHIALVQTQRDLVEQVEAVPVAPPETVFVSPVEPVAAVSTPSEDMAGTPAAMTAVLPVETEVRALRRLPFALAGFVLDLLPLGVFFAMAALVLQWLPELDIRTHVVTREFIYAYVITRVVMAVLRLLLAPRDASLRIVRAGDTAAQLIHRWTRRLVVLATFGVAFGNSLGILGSGPEAQLVVIKATSLLVHLNLIYLVVRFRQPVAVWIAGTPQADGVLGVLRQWLAGVWPLLAAALILGVWIVWAMGIEDGFTRLLEFIGLSAAVLVLGRLAAVLVLGVLGRLAGVCEDESEPEQARGDLRSRLVAQYYPLLRWVVSLVIAAITLVALLETWGIHALQWFVPGTIGSMLASALATIAVAVALAMVVWQAANSALEKRVARWRSEGDLLRAARLNTLLPMLRAALFITIALIIGLTTLSQIGISTAPLIAGAGIIGVALGFGSQKLVQDFINGIFLLMENAMQVGDSVTVGGVSGTVENLSVRTVRLRASDGALHIIPFSSVTTVRNSHRGIGNAAVRVNVSYDTDIDQAIRELKAIGAELREDPVFGPNILADMEIWGVDAVDGAMITLAGQMRCIDKARSGMQREINRRIVERFRRLGIIIADPRERAPASSAPADGAIEG